MSDSQPRHSPTDEYLDHRVASDLAHAATISKLQRCFRCQGTGNQMVFMYQRCEHCNGSGRRHSPHMWAGVRS